MESKLINSAKDYALDENDVEDVITAGYLHDTVEDTDTTPSMLKKLFNDRVAKIVFNVSNERGWSKKEVLFKTLPKIWSCELSIFIKLCDRLANGSNSKSDSKTKKLFKRYQEEYPIFRYALKVDNLYDDIWKELDEIFEYHSLNFQV